jgi:hypothetical protein
MHKHDNPSKQKRLSRLTAWLRNHKLDLAIVTLLLAVSGWVLAASQPVWAF